MITHSIFPPTPENTTIQYWYKDSICVLTKNYTIIPSKNIPNDGSVTLKAVYSLKVDTLDPNIGIAGPLGRAQKPTTPNERISIPEVLEAAEVTADFLGGWVAGLVGRKLSTNETGANDKEECKGCVGCDHGKKR